MLLLHAAGIVVMMLVVVFAAVTGMSAEEGRALPPGSKSRSRANRTCLAGLIITGLLVAVWTGLFFSV